MRENIIIGDVHGSRDEFNQLLDKINYDAKQHRIILVGDLLDRGPDPVGLLKQIRKMDLECVKANHEDKAYRWRQHELRRILTGEKNPMADPTPSRRKEWEALSQKDLQWIANLPLTICAKNNWHIIHGGLESYLPFNEQDPSKVIRTRFLDKNGRAVKLKPDKKQPLNSIFWAEMWNQPYNIVFGHTRFEQPTIFKNINNICVGVDTGVCFGGSLTAYNIDRDEFIQVKAKKKYY